jgi:hypothetical protein
MLEKHDVVVRARRRERIPYALQGLLLVIRIERDLERRHQFGGTLSRPIVGPMCAAP